MSVQNSGHQIVFNFWYFAGNKLRDIPSPLTGVVIYIGAVPSMKKGDNIGYIGEVVDAP